MSFLAFLRHRLRGPHAPAALLALVLQRTPLLRWAATAEALLTPSAGAILKSVATLAALGAYDTVAGATVITPSPTSPARATVGVGFSSAFTITGANGSNSIPGSWSVVPTALPPGLTLNGATVAGLRNGATRTVSILGTPTTAGNYTFRLTAWEASDKRGFSQNFDYTIQVATGGSAAIAPAFSVPPPATVTVTFGQNLSITTTVTGTPAPTLQWFKGTTALPGQTGATLTRGPVTLTDTGAYTVLATNSAKPAGVRSTAAQVTIALPPPAALTDPGTLRTGRVVTLDLTGGQSFPAGVTFKTGALPLGLTLNAATGLITGTLTAKPGPATITAWTQLGAVKSATRLIPLTIGAFPVEILGAYEALLDTGAPAFLPLGKLNLTVSAGGVYSGQLITTDLAAFVLKGQLALTGDDVNANATLTLPRAAPLPPYRLVVALANPAVPTFAPVPALVATLTAGDVTLGSATEIAASARLAVAAPTGAVAGYTFLLTDPVNLDVTASGVGFPLGSGWATGSINATGVLNLTGKNADDTKLTATLNLGADRTFRLYVKPYPKLVGGYLAGPLPLTQRTEVVAPAARWHVSAADGADLVWRKPPTGLPGVNYPTGFGPLRLTGRLESWVKPTAAAPLAAALGLPAVGTPTAGQFTLVIAAPGLANQESDPFGKSLPRTLKLDSTTNLISVVATATPPNPTGFTATLNTATGALTGSFTLPAVAPTPTRKVAYTGVALQTAPADQPGLIAGGFFLLPAPVKGGATPSGQIEFSTP